MLKRSLHIANEISRLHVEKIGTDCNVAVNTQAMARLIALELVKVAEEAVACAAAADGMTVRFMAPGDVILRSVVAEIVNALMSDESLLDHTKERLADAMFRLDVLSQGDRTAEESPKASVEPKYTHLFQAQQSQGVPLCDHPVSAHERVVARLLEWFRDPANGDFEFVDLQAIMIDAGLASRHGCTCFLYDQQVCDICQGRVQPVSETTVPLCDHPDRVTAAEDAKIVKRLVEWFLDPANGVFELEDFQAIMKDVGRWYPDPDAPQKPQDG